MVKIRFWSDSNKCNLETEFSDEDWKVIVKRCIKAGIPLNADVINS